MTNTSTKTIASRAKLPVLAFAGALVLAGCVSPVAGPGGNYAKPIGGSPVTANPTPYSAGLVCLGNYARANGMKTPRIAVGRILDYTGKADLEGGRKVTQGASLMAISAFAKSGVRLVERFDTSVSELELKYANNKLIGDEQPGDFRKIMAGSIPGSDFYLVGGITELNYNIRSVGMDAFVGDIDAEDTKGLVNAKMFVINVGLDLRLVETRSLEVVDVISYQKQIIGREVGLGVFDFLNGNVFDVSVGGRALEPMQLAVRSVVERAVIEMVANLYGIGGPEACLTSDPLGPTTNGVTGDFYTAYDNLGDNNAATRAEAGRWHERRDSAVKSALRGRYD
jgi:curli biogenesis system outer membrane secretion channel CsgG